ncbi:MAG TPA: DNA (cytosine-5-)-methyltransferase [Aggregatilineales bacterium]|nr:DNA (cytosine-5-)-methyltransferase [Aggregatilineales bacterium]
MFTFIDLFAGIGATRIGFERAGGHCVYTSEWDKFSRITYEANHGDIPAGDITQEDESNIPAHDILLAGFPCQPFSISGVSKKNSLGREHGFKDKTQGTLFFEIARILDACKPPALFLENVKNLKTHNRGKTFTVIMETLDELGYSVFAQVLDARYYVPQHRERIFIAGFRKDLFPDVAFTFPTPPDEMPHLADILESGVDEKYTLSDKLWEYLQGYARKHRKKGNGFGFGLIDPALDTTTRTLSARYYKDGSEILIRQEGKNPRRLTPRECARLMGFDDDFIIPVSDMQAYRQFGNSMVVPLVTALAIQIAPILESKIRMRENKFMKEESGGRFAGEDRLPEKLDYQVG